MEEKAQKNKTKSGFTLVELLIAMMIFVMFLGLVIRSYSDVVYTQRGTNEYRLLYSESRIIMDSLIDLLREDYIYFGANLRGEFNSGQPSLTLISKDGEVASTFYLEDEKIMLLQNIGCGREKKEIVLNDERIFVDELSFYVTPAFDPYNEDNVMYSSLQFHPKTTIFLRVKKEKYEIDFQTTVSSRNYSPSIELDLTCVR